MDETINNDEVLENEEIIDDNVMEVQTIEVYSESNSNKIPKEKENSSVEKTKLVRLPLTRVKHIMKMDPECEIISAEAVFLVTKATELFLDCLSKEVVKHTNSTKRKTVLKRDVEAAINSVPNLCFLDGVFEDLGK